MSLFEDQKPVDQKDENVTSTQTTSKVDELVGEGKKFKDVEALAAGKAEADAYIEKLTAQLKAEAEAKAELEAKVGKEDYAKSILEQIKASNNTEGKAQETPAVPELPDVEALIKQQLELKETQTLREQNEAKAKTELTQRYGDGVAEALKQTMEETGMDAKAMDEMAATHPNAFLRLFSVEPIKQPAKPDGLNTTGFGTDGSTKRNRAYYAKLRKEQPDLYRAPATQKQYLEDKKSLGSNW